MKLRTLKSKVRKMTGTVKVIHDAKTYRVVCAGDVIGTDPAWTNIVTTDDDKPDLTVDEFCDMLVDQDPRGTVEICIQPGDSDGHFDYMVDHVMHDDETDTTYITTGEFISGG